MTTPNVCTQLSITGRPINGMMISSVPTSDIGYRDIIASRSGSVTKPVTIIKMKPEVAIRKAGLLIEGSFTVDYYARWLVTYNIGSYDLTTITITSLVDNSKTKVCEVGYRVISCILSGDEELLVLVVLVKDKNNRRNVIVYTLNPQDISLTEVFTHKSIDNYNIQNYYLSTDGLILGLIYSKQEGSGSTIRRVAFKVIVYDALSTTLSPIHSNEIISNPHPYGYIYDASIAVEQDRLVFGYSTTKEYNIIDMKLVNGKYVMQGDNVKVDTPDTQYGIWCLITRNSNTRVVIVNSNSKPNIIITYTSSTSAFLIENTITLSNTTRMLSCTINNLGIVAISALKYSNGKNNYYIRLLSGNTIGVELILSGYEYLINRCLDDIIVTSNNNTINYYSVTQFTLPSAKDLEHIPFKTVHILSDTNDVVIPTGGIPITFDGGLLSIGGYIKSCTDGTTTSTKLLIA